MPHPAVGPDVAAQPPRLRRALEHRGELGTAHAGHHAGGAHRAGPDADLDDVGARLDQVTHALGGHDVAGHDRHPRTEPPYALQRTDHLLLVPVRGVDDQDVRARREQRLGLLLDVTVHADRDRHPQPPGGVHGGLVERRAQGAGPGQDARQPSLGIDDGGEPVAPAVQGLEGLLGVDGVRERDQIPRHDLAELGEPVDAQAVGLGDHADGAALLHDDHCAVRALGQQAERLTHRAAGGQPDRRVDDEVTGLDPADDVGDDVDRDVLGDDRETTAACDGLGHSAARDGGHVGDHDGDRRPAAVGGRQVDFEAGADVRPPGHHEHVVVGQVVNRLITVQQVHVRQHRPSSGRMAGKGHPPF
jgi:hypothetical protein